MKILFIIAAFIGILAVAARQMGLDALFFNKDGAAFNSAGVMPSTSFYDFTMNALDGTPIAFSRYKGKKVVLINVASKCGFTPQYADWQKFHEAHGKDIIVLGFPANDFLHQEPGSNKDIGEFCQKNYGVTFQMFEKITVRGENKAPLYQWLSDKTLNGWNDKAPSWNFCKYIVDENGRLTHFFGSKVKPDDAAFLKAVGL